MSDMDLAMDPRDNEDLNSIKQIIEEKNLPVDKQVNLPKPWKMGPRNGKKGTSKNCYFNPDTGQTFQTKEDLDRYLKFWNEYSRDGKLDLEALKKSKGKRERHAEGSSHQRKGKRKMKFMKDKGDNKVNEEKSLQREGNISTQACEKCHHEECKCFKVPYFVYTRRSKKGVQIMTT